jgi:hypothetical protein
LEHATEIRRKAGRPKLDIDPEEVRELAANGATDTDIGRIVGCTDQTLTNRFRIIIDEARAELRQRLREAQIKCAMKGDRAMLIWLGKQYLDQTDRMTNDTNFDTFEVIIGSKDNNNTAPLAGPTEVLEIGPAD